MTTSSRHDGGTRFAVAADGRRLAFCEWGDPAGAVIFYLHGMPGSRLLRHPGSAYEDAGLRVITYDRPGYGMSDRAVGRKVVDTAADVAVIADLLGLDTFSVAGVSAGGVHAMAVAAALPGRVRRCAAVKSPAPYTASTAAGLDYFEGMAVEDAATIRAAARGDRRALEADAEAAAAWVHDDFPGMAAEGSVAAMLKDAFREAFRQGPGGHVDDLAAHVGDPGFTLSSVVAPTLLLAGRADEQVPPPHARWLATHLPRADLVWIEGGHLAYHEDEEVGAFTWAAREDSEEQRD